MNYKKENDVSYALGAFVVFEALNSKPNFIRKIYTHKEMKNSEEIAKIYKLAKKHNVQITEGSKLIERISGKENVYIMAEFNKYYNKIEAGNQIVLHNPSDMGNVGTILRTALGFDIKNVVFIKPCVDVFNPKVIRASMGALFSLNVVIYENFEDYLCENRDIIKYFFMLDGKNTLQKINFTNNLRSDLREWLSKDGHWEIKDFNLSWSPLLLVGKGNLYLNENFKPILQLNTTSKALSVLIDDLEHKNWLDSKGVFVAKILLS